jgi:hypothetical protein
MLPSEVLSLKIDDFFSAPDSGDSEPHSTFAFRRDLVAMALKGPVVGFSEIELAEGLVQLAHKELTTFGTGGISRIHDEDMQLLIRARLAVCNRLNISFPRLPFRNLTTFRDHWISEGMGGSYAARRNYLDGVFDPVEEALFDLATAGWTDRLVDPISPHGATGWAGIDAEIHELRNRFLVARSAQDHCAVGSACVRILECLGEVVFDPAAHMPKGGDIPARDKTKLRFESVILHEIPGPENETLRKAARAIIELAHEVKHRQTPTRRDAGIACDAVIMLVNLMRRLTIQ